LSLWRWVQTDLSVALDTGEIDSGNELDLGRLVGVVGTTVDFNLVDATLVRALFVAVSLVMRFAGRS
jgi:hypothetical protein